MTIGDECVNSRVSDAIIDAVGIVTGVTCGRDGLGTTAFAFDESPRFDGTDEGAFGCDYSAETAWTIIWSARLEWMRWPFLFSTWSGCSRKNESNESSQQKTQEQ